MPTEFYYKAEMTQLKEYHAEFILRLLLSDIAVHENDFFKRADRTWRETLRLAGTGAMDLRLDSLLVNESDVTSFIKILSRVLSRLSEYGPGVPATEFSDILGYNAASGPIDPKPMIDAVCWLRSKAVEDLRS